MNYILHKFSIGDVEDPDIYAASPLYNWEKSEAGQWAMKNAMEIPAWSRTVSHDTFKYEYCITAKLTPEQYTYWKLKYE